MAAPGPPSARVIKALKDKQQAIAADSKSRRHNDRENRRNASRNKGIQNADSVDDKSSDSEGSRRSDSGPENESFGPDYQMVTVRDAKYGLDERGGQFRTAKVNVDALHIFDSHRRNIDWGKINNVKRTPQLVAILAKKAKWKGE